MEPTQRQMVSLAASTCCPVSPEVTFVAKLYNSQILDAL